MQTLRNRLTYESHADPLHLLNSRVHEVEGRGRIGFALFQAARLTGPVFWIMLAHDRDRLLPGSRYDGAANVLVFANADSASGVRNILKMKANGLEVGPILMGMGNRAHICTPSITVRGLLNMAALAGTAVESYR